MTDIERIPHTIIACCVLHNICIGQLDALQDTSVHDSVESDTPDEPERGTQPRSMEYFDAARKREIITDQLSTR
jgi:hypothetical protein